MKLPLQITYRDIESSAAVETRIRDEADKLDQFYEHIMSCRVVVERQHRHHHEGNVYNVLVDLKVPQAELVAGHERGPHHAHEDIYVAIRDSFAAVRRQLEDYVRVRRGRVKTHEVPDHGRIAELYEDYGRIACPDGRLVYFHRNSVLEGSFEALEPGTEVRFTEEMGELGPQASTVHVIGKHHVVG